MRTKESQPIILVTITGNTTYQGYINQFISDNYEELLEVATKDTEHTIYKPEDLLTELLLFLHSKEDKVRSLVVKQGKDKGTDRGLIRFCAQWMFNTINCYQERNSPKNFKNQFRVKQKNMGVPSISLLEAYIDVSPHVIELLNQKQKEEDVINAVLLSLSESEKRLYDIYFIQGHSVPQIKKMIPELGKYPLYQMVRDLKDKIRTEFKNQLNELN